MRKWKVIPAFTTAWRFITPEKYSAGMLMSVNTSRSGSHRVRVPVFFAWDLGRGVFWSSPTISPRSKRRRYSKPSRQTVTSI